MRANYTNTNTGDKIRFTGSGPFWFTNMVKDAEDFLERGKIYTVALINANSSWTAVTLEEFKEKTFSLHWFERI